MIFLDDETAQLKRFQSFCIWLVVVSLALGSSEVMLGLISGAHLLLIGSSMVGVAALAGGWAYWRSRRHDLTRTVIQLCAMLLVTLTAASFILPPLWSILLVAAIMVVISSLPYVGGVALRNLLGGAFVGGIAITLAGNFMGIPFGFSAPPSWIIVSMVVLGMISALALIVLLLWQFSERLQELVGQLRRSNAELELERSQLEGQVATRTADLSDTLQTIQQREADLARTLDQLHVNQQTLRAVSAPIIPVLPGVIIAPLIGEIDTARAGIITDHVMAAVEHERARYVILDMTGIPFVDDDIAQAIVNLAATVRLLGAQVLLAGIRPEVAQTLVARSLDLGGTRSYANLREAVRALV